MKIAVASGKGGTGKTTVALALAVWSGEGAALVDCDVEEPNCHLFFDGSAEWEKPVTVKVPQFLPDRCTGCGTCSQVCRFHALAGLKNKVLVFPELCHSCGGCTRFCPAGALVEIDRPIGRIEYRSGPGFALWTGVLDIGNALAPPVIRALKAAVPEENATLIYDAPPGTACPMVTTVRGMDYVLLVTEPTPFGLNDLQLAVATLQRMDLACGVVINRSDPAQDELIEKYCAKENLPVWLKIPFSRRIAAGYAQGRMLSETAPELKAKFITMMEELEKR